MHHIESTSTTTEQQQRQLKRHWTHQQKQYIRKRNARTEQRGKRIGQKGMWNEEKYIFIKKSINFGCVTSDYPLVCIFHVFFFFFHSYRVIVLLLSHLTFHSFGSLFRFGHVCQYIIFVLTIACFRLVATTTKKLHRKICTRNGMVSRFSFALQPACTMHIQCAPFFMHKKWIDLIVTQFHSGVCESFQRSIDFAGATNSYANIKMKQKNKIKLKFACNLPSFVFSHYFPQQKCTKRSIKLCKLF